MVKVLTVLRHEIRTTACRHHCHFEEWPNYGVPDNAETYCSYLTDVEALRQQAQQVFHANTTSAEVSLSALEGSSSAVPESLEAATEAPMIVHCSGGIGRSGSFIAAHSKWREFTQIAELIDGGSPTDSHAYELSLVPVITVRAQCTVYRSLSL